MKIFPRRQSGHLRRARPTRDGPFATRLPSEREFLIDNLLVRIHFVIEMIWWTDFAPCEFELPFRSSLISDFLVPGDLLRLYAFRAFSLAVPKSMNGGACDAELLNVTLLFLTTWCKFTGRRAESRVVTCTVLSAGGCRAPRLVFLWFRGRLVFEAHRLVYPSTSGSRTFKDL